MTQSGLNSCGVRIVLWRILFGEPGPTCFGDWREVLGLEGDDPRLSVEQARSLFEDSALLEHLRAARDAGDSSPSIEAWIRRPDDERRLLRVVSCNENNAEGETVGRFGVGVDITDLSQAFAEARENANLLSTFVDNAPAAIAMFDRDMRYLRVSKRWIAEYGLFGQDLIGRSHYDVFPEIPQHWKDKHKRCQAGAVEQRERELFVRADGRRQWLSWEVRPWFDASGAIGGILMLTRDITPMIESMEALERSEKRLRLALDVSGDVVWQRDRRTGEFSLTASKERLGGRALPEIVSERDLWDLIHPDDRDMMTAAFADAVNRGAVLKFEHRLRSEDESERWGLSAIEPLRDENGVHVGAIGVLKDITDQKLEQRALAQAREEAESASAAKSEFLAVLSHEIRTPLNGVMGVAQMLAKTPLNAQQQEMVDLLISAGRALKRLVDDSLDIGRIESGGATLDSAPFDVGVAIRESAMLFSASAGEKGVAFECQASEGAWVNGDELRVRQIVTNLVGNAVKFTDAGAVRVTCTARPRIDGDIDITVRVSDTGAGIDEASKGRIFDRFVKGESGEPNAAEAREGAGLGLAIARSLARAMRGDISCVSSPGLGSIFTFMCRLPQAPAQASDVEDVTEFESQGHTLVEILVAEDHKMNQKILSMLLEGVAARVTFVDNGLAACAAVEKTHYDLLLMDVQMPVLDGLSATRLIRARESISGGQRLPIICLTAQATPQNIKEAEDAGVDAYVVKPIDKEALFRAIDAVLSEDALPPRAKSA